jgi:hypothetical protein
MTQERDFNRASLAAISLSRCNVLSSSMSLEYGMEAGTPVARATALPARSAFAAAELPPCFRGEVEA